MKYHLRTGAGCAPARIEAGFVASFAGEAVAVKAVRLHEFHSQPVVDEVPEPVIGDPLDVIVRIGGAGVCRTDLHIIDGQWDAAMQTPLPYVLGHENAGWVHEVGSAVTNVSVGDTVILHPTTTCGLCRACRAGDDMHCAASAFPGLSRDGGMAEYLLTSARACVKLDSQTQPQDVAALADAGITAYHAVKKAIPLLYPGTTCVVIGAGGLGHIGIQCLAALTATRIIVVDRSPAAAELAGKLGAEHTVVADGSQVTAVSELTAGRGAEVVLDFVAEQGAEADGFAMTAPAGSYFVIGYGGTVHIPTLDIISTERNIIGNIVGTYNELAELMALAQAGRVTLHTKPYPLADAQQALADLDAGQVRGRAILVP
ncbi:MAG TPA: NAD(P)-dependent alcohol dehydrogenase [Streptosporangiaceae bacterium]|nr:NAD(P)-dependent alcohol dehydrogenase [Streptosporangiaceae bacterium]